MLDSRRWIVASVVSLLLAGFIFLCLQVCVGAYLSGNGSPSRLEQATMWDPLNAEPWVRLGHQDYLGELAPERSLRDFDHAVHLNPLDAQAWLEMAYAAQAAGKLELQRTALERALAADPTTPAYELAAANSYLAAGDAQTGFQQLRDIVKSDPDSLPSALDLAWRASHDAGLILRQIVPGNTEGQLIFLQLLASRDREQDAAAVWKSVLAQQKPYDPTLVFPYVQYLLEKGLGAQAQSVWYELTSHKEFSGYRSSANLLVNAGFENDVLNAGLDWRYQPLAHINVRLGTSAVHGGKRALCLTFDGAAAETGISQYVAVDPGTEYELTGFYRSDQLEGAGGLQWEVRDVVTHNVLFPASPESATFPPSLLWEEFRDSFKTAPETSVVLIKLERVPAGDILRGTGCLDDLSLSRK